MFNHFKKETIKKCEKCIENFCKDYGICKGGLKIANTIKHEEIKKEVLE